MSAYYLKVTAKTREEAEKKAAEEIKRIDFMRQPSLYSVAWHKPADQVGLGEWVATIKYWGVD